LRVFVILFKIELVTVPLVEDGAFSFSIESKNNLREVILILGL